jgi:Fem-1 family protein b
MFYFRYPCLHSLRILLKCGADVNGLDVVRNTPLHIFVSNSNNCDETIFQLLCDAGAHLDWINALGETPADIASNANIKQLLNIKMKLSLKCLCARLIQKNDIPFHGMISTSLVTFVERH